GFVSVSKRYRLFVGTSDLFPGFGGSAPVARHLESVWRRNFFTNFYVAAGAPDPRCKLSVKPGVIVSLCHFEDKASLPHNLFKVAIKPRRLHLRRSDGGDALKLAGLHRQFVSLTQNALGMRVASTDSQMPQYSKGGNSCDCRYSVNAQYRIHIIRDFVPLALFEMCTRPPRHHVKLRRQKVFLRRVLHALINAAHPQFPVP